MGVAQEGSGSCVGWRDLRQTKWRLSKGDEQLDFTFQSAPVAHHISDEAMSELAVCIYKVLSSLAPGGPVNQMSEQHRACRSHQGCACFVSCGWMLGQGK